LFWKKEKKNDNNHTDFVLVGKNERRSSFRVRPSEEAPIRVIFDGRDVYARDIGAAGLSFQNPDCKISESYAATIELPNLKTGIEARLEIITIDPQGFCHCEFKEIDADAAERIHQFVLNRQKEILKSKF